MEENPEEEKSNQSQSNDQSSDAQNQNGPDDPSSKERFGPISIGDEDDPTKIKIEANPGELITGTWGFLRSILSLRTNDYDVKSVVAEIKGGVQFKGYNVWILMCSIIVASVGLNMNSTAVIVGAMLISPLMGPIRGMGFGVAMNDFPLLVESVKNFGITVAISMFAAFMYFLITPIDGITDELWARTSPTFMDVIIAFFGGLAGVIAAARGKNDTVIPGVAIATALMPPLCTAGYGLANAEWGYFLGASYLFLLNSLLIGISTIIFVRYVRFPKKSYLTPKIERRVTAYIWVFMILIVSPSIWQFYKMAKVSVFEEDAQKFVNEVVMSEDEFYDLDTEYEFDFDNSVIHLIFTDHYIDSSTENSWNLLKDHYDLEYAAIEIHHGVDQDAEFDKRLSQLEGGTAQDNRYLRRELGTKRSEIRGLKTELEALKKKYGEAEPLNIAHLVNGIKQENPEVNQVALDRSFHLNKDDQMDTTYILHLGFKRNVDEEDRNDLVRRIQRGVFYEIQQKTNSKQDSLPVILSE